ncbi:MupG family TIM beta-alpha barrel fold protein [Treponema phagedenis]|uniref:DUF871 domain-containing protein n=1 Tax=Treponema phagedenis TaxID=162 RepID=A0AAE6M7B1_TREPH|nr:MupG family TIM beta-alpha barrel fold protein [Treponema phagedenis]EFW38428.1 hypothetical protein HMPREF9554_01067 [Treponema phagedenis F0421]NVP25534.1 DUF871 domain-containing protein [Treponema phagedenis]QEJ95922.1 DUF871 domain-containing protein [Treponema phagedenis]QEJ97334.1 DUF871 domain-containing protein [Treponema phagedenis]QEK00379.1 DUF871 domain-containing protein [Treponema phagedenis]
MLGWSVFISQFDLVKNNLPLLFTKEAMIFTSLHITEEFDPDYTKRAFAMCHALKDMGYDIIADVSPKTLTVFDEKDAAELAKKLRISMLRLDYGFSFKETAALSQKIPLCLNASTLKTGDIIELQKQGGKCLAMHNYYPRPETGLDGKTFKKINRNLSRQRIKVFSFIPGDTFLRGPLHEGLPTLEKHRNISPYAAYVEMVKKYGVTGVFIGDGIISSQEYKYIQTFILEDIITVPIVLEKDYRYLHEKIFTIRSDSPNRLLRFQESRDYAAQGNRIPVGIIKERIKGALTIDNENYLRYSGEIQLIRKTLPQDNRVNVIGQVPAKYLPLLKQIKNGKKIKIQAL